MGWSVSRNAAEPDSKIVARAEDLYLYPVVGDIHWVDFDSNGGTPVESKYYHWNEVTEKPADQPTKPGYTLEGWYTQKENGDPYQFGGKLDKDITLFAHWEPAKTSHYRVLYYIQTSNPKYDSTAPMSCKKLLQKRSQPLSAEGTWDDRGRSLCIYPEGPCKNLLWLSVLLSE